METPSLLAVACEGEPVEAEVPLGGDDRLVVTPTRTLIYRAEGLLRDEAVETIAHDVDRVELTEGRRKTTIATSSLTGEEEFTVPTKRLDDVLSPLLNGVLRAAGETADDEAMLAVYRFSELTLVVTEGRVVKHIGTALWDTEYESYPFSAVTDLSVEEGSVATQLVLTVDGRPQRIKTPNEQAGTVRQTLEGALCDYHGVDSLVALRTKNADETEAESGGAGEDRDDDGSDTESDAAEAGGRDAGRTVEPLLTDDSDDGPTGRRASEQSSSTATAQTNGVTGTAVHDDEVLERLEALEATVEHQTELIERQQETLELLIEELRQGR
ncbi:hypothetical protein ACFPYI_11810 [Halomarina salina]|uniref:DUF7115 domain-containing protein n=1 Tax=Halomarina salina TaxID=1872699 RepID=A0ABD5RNR9_9EURY|nr:hypothetical protein [Halomarina salina]